MKRVVFLESIHLLLMVSHILFLFFSVDVRHRCYDPHRNYYTQPDGDLGGQMVYPSGHIP